MHLSFNLNDVDPTTAALVLLAVAALCLIVGVLYRRKLPWSFEAKVSWVCDGDSIWVKKSFGRRVKLRLRGIDAPEMEQKFGLESQEVLKRMISGRRVSIVVYEWDAFGRGVASIKCSGRDVCLLMIEEGAAWPYYTYLKRCPKSLRADYIEAGELARIKRRGLWRENNPEAPWDWRARHRSLWSRFIFWIKKFLRKFICA